MHKVNRILVATDFSEACTAAVQHAATIAEQQDAILHIIHIDDRSNSRVTQEDEKRLAAERLAAQITPEAELNLKTVKDVLFGEPAKQIVKYAKQNDVDQIVVGTHGRTGLAHLALGSVAERVLRLSDRPVLVVRSQEKVGSGTLDGAAGETLHQKFGGVVQGDREDLLERFKKHLATDSRFADPHEMIETLQSKGCLVWSDQENDGSWKIVLEAERHGSTSGPRFSDSPELDLIARAHRLRATDIHIDPVNEETGVLVRFRIDGNLERYCSLDESVADHLTNRLKILGRLDITDPFGAKEGRLHLPSELSDLEVRMTSVPVAGGEAIALRLLTKSNLFFPLHELGFSDQTFEDLQKIVKRNEGLLLVTGPTGNGKSTTVYSILQTLSDREQIIVSIEDPVEYSVPFVRQMEVDERHGISMSSGLKTILRMDPDVVFLGEVRDAQAADICLRAASSGRYVLSTLHTRNVASTVTALRDLGVADRSIAANLNGVINQRLVRKLCERCRQEKHVDDRLKRIFEQNQLQVPGNVFERKGCSDCRNTGFLGRIGVFEATVIPEDVADAIAVGLSENEISDLLLDSGMTKLSVAALRHVAIGATDWQEAESIHWLI